MAAKIAANAEKEIEKSQERLEKVEARLLEKEEKIDFKKEELEQTKAQLNEESKKIQELIEAQTIKLSEISGLSKEDAKELLFENIKTTEEKEIQNFIDKYRTIKKEEADKEAMQVIARVMPRIAAESVGEFTSELIDIPDE